MIREGLVIVLYSAYILHRTYFLQYSASVVNTLEKCESCGKTVEPIGIARNLEEQFINDARKNKCICVDCFRKRYRVNTKKRSGYGGTIYELDQKAAPRFGLGSSKLSCLKCEWVAWTEEGITSHMQKKHPK
ncbi:MAG: hypothetical protein ACW985_01145 [Candidatus Thorarchaeota archaeon]|jgi:hypothetical protein